MRTQFAFVAMLIASMTLSAKSLSPEEALQRAASESGRQNAPALRGEATKLVFTQFTDANAPAVYVFSDKKKGFSLLSADDVAAPVLGFSDNQDFDPSDMPPALSYMLECYAAEIEAAQGLRSFRAPQEDTRAVIAPKLTTHWNQDYPYNSTTPVDNGEHSATGCVATAMAQVMNFHRWPHQGEGTAQISFNQTSYTKDLSQVSFDWGTYQDQYSGSCSGDEAAKIGALMEACGYSVGMQYSANASGAGNTAIAKALVENFDYSPNVSFRFRESYSLNAWIDAVYTTLAEDGPVIYTGVSAANEGHAFVVDGYAGDNYFHVNWGWGGMSDGNFLLSALDPYQQGIGGSKSGFNLQQGAVFGAKAAQGEAVGRPYVFIDAPEKNIEFIATKKAISIFFPFVSGTPTQSGLKKGYIIYNSAGKVVKEFVDTSVYTYDYMTYPEKSKRWENREFTGPTYLNTWLEYKSDTYKLYLTYTDEGIINAKGEVIEEPKTHVFPPTDEWPGYLIIDYKYDYKYGNDTYEAIVPKSGALEIADVAVPDELYAGLPMDLKLKVNSSYADDYALNYAVVLINSDNEYVKCKAASDILQSGENELTYSSDLAQVEEGTYKLYVMSADFPSEGYTQYYGPKEVSVVSPGESTIELVKWSFNNTSDAQTEGKGWANNLWFTATVKCTQGIHYGHLVAYVFPYEESAASAPAHAKAYVKAIEPANLTVTSVYGLQSEDFLLREGEVKEISAYDYNSSPLESGKKYFAMLQTVDNTKPEAPAWIDEDEPRVISMTNELSGVESVSVSDDSVPAEYYDLQGRKVASPKGGLYIRRQGTKAEKVALP